MVMKGNVVFVPYSEGNTVDKKPLPQKVRITTSAIPRSLVMSAVEQAEKQGWDIELNFFCGLQKESIIAMAQQPSVPMEQLVFRKTLCEGDEITPPVFKF